MSDPPPIEAVLFDIGGTLVHEADPATPVAAIEARAVEGAAASLEHLRAGYRLGAVTNTSIMDETRVRELLHPLGLSALLEVVVTSRDAGADKPDPQALLLALDELRVAPENALFVGDRDSDREAAHRAGCAFAWATEPVHRAVERHHERASSPALQAAREIEQADETARLACRAHVAKLATPPGALGQLGAIAEWLSAIAGVSPPPEPRPSAVCVFVADHGVAAEGVTAWPSWVTRAVAGEAARGHAAISVLARSLDVRLDVVDVGTIEPFPPEAGVRDLRVRPGTASLAAGPAMSEREALEALDKGHRVARELVGDGARALVPGEIGIGNTTAASCLVGALTGRPSEDVVGRGAGADDETLARKRAVVRAALDRIEGLRDPVEILAEVGGIEIVAITGFILGAAQARVPVILDGVITLAAALAARAIEPHVCGYLLAGHLPSEPAAPIVLKELGLTPILRLDMAVGEGTGGCLAVPIVQAAARLARDGALIEDVVAKKPDGETA